MAMALCGVALVSAFVVALDLHAPPDDVLTLDRARASFSTDDPTAHADAGRVRLPQNWTLDLPPSIIGAEGTLAGSYSFAFDRTNLADGPLSLLIPRVSQGARVEFNGEPLFDHDGLDPQSIWDWYTPRRIDVPQKLVLAGHNRLDVAVLAKAGSVAGLSRLYIGPQENIAAMHQRLLLLQKTLPVLANLAVLVMAIPLLLVWLHGRHVGEGPFADYGILAASAAIFALRSMHVQVGTMPVTHPFWLPLVGASLGWSMAFFYVFLLRSVDVRSKTFEVGLAIVVAFGTLVLFSVPQSRFTELMALLWYLPIAAVGVTCVAIVAFRTIVRPDRDRGLLSVTLCILAPAGVHDALWAWGMLSFEALLWMPMIMPAVLLVITGNMANSFVRTWVNLRTLNGQLIQRVDRAKAEIARAYESRLEAERREVVARERARLIEDLHDGVGGRLAALVATLKTSRLPADRITVVVNDCLNDLHTVVTARDAGTLGEAFADLCAHNALLLEASGYSLVHYVDPAIGRLRLGPQAMVNVLRITQEAISNAVRHSQGNAVRITCEPANDGHIVVRIVDNGKAGKAVADATSSSGGRGMSTMRARAARLHGEIAIQPAGEGWNVSLTLPIRQNGAGGDTSAASEPEPVGGTEHVVAVETRQ